MTKRSPFLIFFLAFVSAIFIGILIFVYIVTKQANPVMLDEHGRPVPTASLLPCPWGRLAACGLPDRLSLRPRRTQTRTANA
jgi:hypothetical protein